jgi:hypothetical protein
LFSKAKVELPMALEVILRLDVTQENRILSVEERDIHARLKRRIIGLAALERTRKRQASRVTNLKEGNANTRYFHLRVNARRRKITSYASSTIVGGSRSMTKTKA